MKQRAWNALLLATGVSASAAFASISESRRQRPDTTANTLANNGNKDVITSASSVLKASGNGVPEKSPDSSRTYKTAADKHFSNHGTLPLPPTVHAVLKQEHERSTSLRRKNIFVIGDVHGCLEELLLLHKKAVEINDNQDFAYVILVGDLCNKGPASVEVVKHVRSQGHRWLAVRGNHDDASLAASLGDKKRRNQEKYNWVTDQSSPERTLTDEDVMFLADLPYSIRIPRKFLGISLERDTLIVHAGFVPGVALEKQTIETMTTIRDVQKNLNTGEYVNTKQRKSKDQESLAEDNFSEPVAWARAWQGPYQVIFGHDARRGYQRYEGDWAIGLDTGACYGKKLTGLIFPSKTIVSIDSLETYCPISKT